MQKENHKKVGQRSTFAQEVEFKIKAKENLIQEACDLRNSTGSDHIDFSEINSKINNMRMDIDTLRDKLKTKPHVYGNEFRLNN